MIDAVAGSRVDAAAGLIERAVAGDEAAFAVIVERHNADLVRVAYVVAGDLDTAEEAAASAWIVAWRRLGTLREPDRLRAWLVSIAANEARQLRRRQRRRSVREISATRIEAGSAQDPSAGATHVDIADALNRLSPDERTLVALRYFAGLNSTEIARATGTSASTTRVRLLRLRDRLRKELGDE